MQRQISTSGGHANLTLNYHHNVGGFNGLSRKDLQVMSAEFVGTFFLALIIGATKVTSFQSAQPVAIGFGLVALVYCTGPISGGQLNPAVTVGLMLRGKLTLFEGIYCMVFQFLGAFVAGLVCYGLYHNNWDDIGFPEVSEGYSKSTAFAAEILQSFALVLTVLNVATTKSNADNSYFGVAIGFVVLSGAITEGGKSGACYNPAVAMLTLLNGDTGDLWVFFTGPLIGGALAGLIFPTLNPLEIREEDFFKFNVFSSLSPERQSALSALLMEFIGTFFLVYTIALTANADVSGFVAVGTILTSMIYAGGSVSGGHYNPAVTLGVFLRERLIDDVDSPMPIFTMWTYYAAQLIGGFAAGACAAYVNEGKDSIASPEVNEDSHTRLAALIAEFLFSFILVLAVLSAATCPKVKGNSFFGMAIGFVVIAGVVTVADISGGSFNPAVAVALSLFKGDKIEDLWVYVVGPMVGAPLASLLFSFWILGEQPASSTGTDGTDSSRNGVISMRASSAMHQDRNTDNVL